MPILLSSQRERASQSTRSQLLSLFWQLLALDAIEQTLSGSKRRFYRRVWCPLLTLWYLIWQRLQSNHTLQAVVTDARRGGADALRLGHSKALSQRIVSRATTAFSKARARLPLAWVKSCFTTAAQRLTQLGQALPTDTLPLQLWDGSTLRMRPLGDVPKHFPPIVPGEKNLTGALRVWWSDSVPTRASLWRRKWLRCTAASRHWQWC